MSTNLDCRFIHLRAGWYYLLEQWGHRREYDAFGPFASSEKARAHLYGNGQGNPGAIMWDDDEGGDPRDPDRWETELVSRARL